MAQKGADTFIRADQTNWGNASDGQAWANVGGPGSYRILSNRGHIGNFNGYTVNRLGSGTTADIDAEVSINLGDSSFNGAGIAWRVADINNGYRLVTFDNSIYLDKYVAGVRTNITNVFIGFSNSDQLRMRVQHIGSTLKCNLWNLSGSEPAWAITVTESSISSAGAYGLISDLFGGTGMGEVQYYDVLVTDGATVTTSSRTVPTSAVLLQTSSRTVPTSVALELTSQRTIPTSAVLKQTSTRTVPTSAVLELTSQRTVPTEAVLQQTSTRTVPTSAALQLTSSRTVPTSAAILQLGSRTVPTSAALKATLQRVVPTSAVLSGISHAPPANCTVIVRSGAATAKIRSGSATAIIRS